MSMGPILRLSSNGANCYPIGGGKHVMVTPSGEAHITTLHAPERLEVVVLGHKPRDIKPEEMIRDLVAIGRMNRTTGKHRDRGHRSPTTMCWISASGHLCRSDSLNPFTRVEAGLPPITVAQGDVWSVQDENEQDA